MTTGENTSATLTIHEDQRTASYRFDVAVSGPAARARGEGTWEARDFSESSVHSVLIEYGELTPVAAGELTAALVSLFKNTGASTITVVLPPATPAVAPTPAVSECCMHSAHGMCRLAWCECECHS